MSENAPPPPPPGPRPPEATIARPGAGGKQPDKSSLDLSFVFPNPLARPQPNWRHRVDSYHAWRRAGGRGEWAFNDATGRTHNRAAAVRISSSSAFPSPSPFFVTSPFSPPPLPVFVSSDRTASVDRTAFADPATPFSANLSIRTRSLPPPRSRTRTPSSSTSTRTPPPSSRTTRTPPSPTGTRTPPPPSRTRTPPPPGYNRSPPGYFRHAAIHGNLADFSFSPGRERRRSSSSQASEHLSPLSLPPPPVLRPTASPQTLIAEGDAYMARFYAMHSGHLLPISWSSDPAFQAAARFEFDIRRARDIWCRCYCVLGGDRTMGLALRKRQLGFDGDLPRGVREIWEPFGRGTRLDWVRDEVRDWLEETQGILHGPQYCGWCQRLRRDDWCVCPGAERLEGSQWVVFRDGEVVARRRVCRRCEECRLWRMGDWRR